MKKIAIIGAGLSGVSIAHLLKDKADITLFEKSRGVSGRMSTRRSEPYFFDHGAQYFTVRTKPFQDFIQPLLNQGVIALWNSRYVRFKGNQKIKNDGVNEEPRYVGVPGMNQIVKYLTKDFDIHLNTRIVAIEKKNKWQLIDEKEQQYLDFDWVICSAPSPQAAELLPEYFAHYKEIKNTHMKACFALMLGFEKDLLLDFDSAHVTGSDVSWIAVNSHKPKRLGSCSLVVHSSEAYAEKYMDDDRELVTEHLIEKVSNIIGCDLSNANYKTLHGWRYANNADKNKKTPLCLDSENKLAVCGDWLMGGRVEGAFSSAYHLAEKIKDVL